jgi:hypothetical protein
VSRLGERLTQELALYGLPEPEEGQEPTERHLEVLLRHVYANRDLTRQVQSMSIDMLTGYLDEWVPDWKDRVHDRLEQKLTALRDAQRQGGPSRS